jgi:hypothetical protein
MLKHQGDLYGAEQCRKERDTLKADNARLREALEKINHLSMSMFINGTDMLLASKDIARTALKGE